MIRRPRAGRILAVVVLIALGYVSLTGAQVWAAARRDGAADPAGPGLPADAIVVLGAAQYNGEPSPALAARLDHAAALWQRGVAPVLVVTGGAQPGDRFTEASASARYLHRLGVPDEALLREVQGSSTWESLAATARIMRGRGWRRAVLVSDAYHSLRVAAIAADVGLEALVSPTPRSPSRSLATAGGRLARETAAVALGRVVGYRRLTVLEQRVDLVRATVV